MDTAYIVIFWILGTLLCAGISYDRGFGPWHGFWLGLILSPVIGLVLVLTTKAKVSA